MGITAIFRHVVDAFKPSPIIKETEAFQRKCINNIIQETAEKDYNDNQGWNGNATTLLRKNLENNAMSIVINNYPERMHIDRGGSQYMHSYNNKTLFLLAAKETLPENILKIAKYISDNQVMRKSISIEDGNDVMEGINILTKKCPIEDRQELYYVLASTGLLNDAFPNSNAASIALFTIEVMKGVETDTALNMLKHLEAWRELPKDQNLSNWLANRDKRLLPAIQYSNTEAPTLPSQDIG